MSSHYPDGVTQRTHDEAFAGPRSADISALICPSCKREMIERWSGLWFVGEQSMRDEPLAAPRGEQCCSTACLSQFVYESAPEDVQLLMRSLGRIVHSWSETVRLRRSDRSMNLEWALKHSWITFLMSRLTLEVADDQMEDFAEALIGRDAVTGGGNYPQWYLEATAEMGARHGAQGDPATHTACKTPRALPTHKLGSAERRARAYIDRLVGGGQ